MRHKKVFKKLNRTASHRRALLRNLATALVLHNRIETTLPKAKALKRVADKLVTLGKKDSLHARRQAMTFLFPINKEASGNAEKWTSVHRLFTEIAPGFAGRNGGYTRVVRSRKRDGDNAQLAIIEFVEFGMKPADKKKKRRVVTRSEVTTPASEVPAVEADATSAS